MEETSIQRKGSNNELAEFYGHHRRVIEQFRRRGLDNLDGAQVLELLLCYGIPKGDTFLVSHELINRFGSFSQVMEATAKELKKIPGMNERSTDLIRLVSAIPRYCITERRAPFEQLSTIDACARHIMLFLKGKRAETVYMLCLDAKCKAICCLEVGKGSLDSANVPIKRIVETALSVNAVSVVLAHNQLDRTGIPTRGEVVATAKAARALDYVDVHLADHLLISNNDYVSMAKYGYYRPETRGFTV